MNDKPSNEESFATFLIVMLLSMMGAGVIGLAALWYAGPLYGIIAAILGGLASVAPSVLLVATLEWASKRKAGKR